MHSLVTGKFSIKRKESGLILMMILLACFLGIFLSTFEIAVHTVFLKTLNQKDMALAYLFSGMFGVPLFYFYSLAYKRVSVQFFHFMNLCLIFVAFGVFYYSSFTHPGQRSAFYGMVIFFPLNLLAVLNFWRYANKLFHSHQFRRLSPLIETGLIFGLVAGGFLVLSMQFFYNQNIILMQAALSITILLFLQFPVYLLHKRGKIFNHHRDQYIPVKRSLFFILSSKYTSYLFLFALISATISYLIHYGFINLAKESYDYTVDSATITFNVKGLAKFYGLFLGVLYLVIIFVRKVLVKKVLYTYDSPYSIILLPLAIAFFLILAVVVYLTIGGLVILERVTMAFVLIGINKIVCETSRYSIQLPSLNTLYRTLDLRFLQIIIPGIEGSVPMFGIFLAGSIVLFLINIRFYGGFIVLLATLLLTPLWFFFAVKLIKAYRTALKSSYKKLRISRASGSDNKNVHANIRKMLGGDKPVKVIQSMKISALTEPLTYEQNLRRMLMNPKPEIQEYVIQCIKQESLLELLPDLKKTNPLTGRSGDILKETIGKFEKRIQLLNNRLNIGTLVASRNIRDRKMAAEFIGTLKEITYTTDLVNLAREFEPDVRIAAVKAMARISSADHSYILIEFLSSGEYCAFAFDALTAIGDPALEHLERIFLDPGIEDKLLTRVIRIYGRIGSVKAIELLLNKLENQSRRVTSQAVAALHEANFQANELNLHRILNVVVRTIGTLGWNMMAYKSIPREEKYDRLRLAYSDELTLNYNMLYNLLSLAYNARTIGEIRQLLDRGDPSDISHAIEMLDHFVNEDIKPVLFPVIENLSLKERIKKLQYYFPIEEMDQKEIVSSTLTRDYNLLTIYPRVCAAELVLEVEGMDLNQELISNVFHPNPLLREVASIVLFKKEPGLFESVLERIDKEINFEIRNTIHSIEKADQLLLIEKWHVLRQTTGISGLEEEIVIKMAGAFLENRFSERKCVDLNAQAEEYALFLCVRGKMQFDRTEINTRAGGQYRLFYSKILMNSGVPKICFSSGALVLGLNNRILESLLFDYPDITNCILSCIENYKLAD